MGKLHKKWRSASLLGNVLDKKTYQSIHPLGTQAEMQYDATVAAEKALKEAEDPNNPANKVIPIADEEELAKQRRRRNASRRGSTSSNIYTSDERLGG